MNTHLQKGQYVEKRFRASSDDIEVKEDGDGHKRVRMPISSTAEDRDGDEFSRDGIENLQRQVNEGKVPAFLDHGRGSRGGYYGALGIVGTWADGEIVMETHEGEEVDVLYADFVPTKANEDAEDIVALLEDDMPVGASIGFRIIDYERDRDEGKFIFHSTDLLETSIVGIPSNPLTVNDGADAIGAKALGSPEVFRRAGAAGQPIYPMAMAGAGAGAGGGGGLVQNHSAGADETMRLSDLTSALERTLEELDDRYETDSPTDSDPERDADLDETMSNKDDDGGDDPANDDLAELRDFVERQAETNAELADSINSLVETFEECNDPGIDADGGDGLESEGETEGKGNEPDVDADAGDDTIQLFVGEDADEDVRKEFEALQEKANYAGEIDLADAETLQFGTDDEDASKDNDTPAAQKGGLI